MNGFKQLTVENFQSHQKSVVEFAPTGQLTIIIGRSRSGKTALIRALRWLLYNSPRGVSVSDRAEPNDNGEKSGYCRVGASFIRVTLEMESGHVVVRERTRSKNQYKIIAPNAKEPQVFEGFGDSVPLEVQVITGVRPIRIGDTEVNLNLSEQLDGPFMGTKSMSAPARAKVLGKLAGTEEIDYASQKLAVDLRRREQDEKRLAVELEETEGKLAEFNWLPVLEERIRQVAQLVATVKAAQERKDALTKLQAAMGENRRRIDAAQGIIWQHQYIEAAELAIVRADDRLSKKIHLVRLTEQLDRMDAEILDCQRILQRLHCLEHAGGAMEKAQAATSRRNSLLPIRRAYLATKMRLEQTQAALAKTETVEAAAGVVVSMEETYRRCEKLSALRHNYNVEERRIVGAEEVLRRTEGISEANMALDGAKRDRETADYLLVLRRRHEANQNDIQRAREAAVLWENRVAELEGAYRDELVSLGKCPVCGGTVNLEKLKEVC